MKTKIVQSGIIYTLLSFVTGGCNFYFQRILSSALDGDNGEYGAFKTTAVFVTLLGLPLSMATQAVIHHIAHYQGTGNEARLNGLLAGCRSFLLKFTIVVSLLGVDVSPYAASLAPWVAMGVAVLLVRRFGTRPA